MTGTGVLATTIVGAAAGAIGGLTLAYRDSRITLPEQTAKGYKLNDLEHPLSGLTVGAAVGLAPSIVNIDSNLTAVAFTAFLLGNAGAQVKDLVKTKLPTR